MKLTATQLRRIIAEEVKRATLREGSDELSVASGDYAYKLDEMIAEIRNHFKSQFNPMDPSMDAAGGKPAWDAQCDAACEDLEKKINSLIMDVEEDLHDGVYGE